MLPRRLGHPTLLMVLVILLWLILSSLLGVGDAGALGILEGN